MHLACFGDNEKCGRDTISKMLGHYERWGGDPAKAKNRKWMDEKKIGRNWNLAPERAEGIEEYCRGLIGKYVRLGAKMTAKSAPMCDVLVTVPEGLPDKLVVPFFEAVYDELVERVGSEDNVVCAYVHMDEPKARPHMHFCFVQPSKKAKMTNDKSRPLRWTEKDEKRDKKHKAGTVKKDKKGTVRYEQLPVIGADGKPVVTWSLSPSAVWTRAKLQTFHQEMDKAVAAKLGLGDACGLLLQEGDMNKELSHLDHDEYAKVTKARDKARADAQKAAAAAELSRQEAEDAERAEKLARDGLECVRRAESAGPIELARAAADRDAAGDERAAEAEHRELEREYLEARSRNVEAQIRNEAARRDNEAARREMRRGAVSCARALDRCWQLAASIVSALPRLFEFMKGRAFTVVLHVPGLDKLADASMRLAAKETLPVLPTSPEQATAAYAAVAAEREARGTREYIFEVDDGCRLCGDEAGWASGIDVRTWQTDEDASEAARSRVRAKKDERAHLQPVHADLAAQMPQNGEKGYPAWRAADAARLCAADEAGWAAALGALGFHATRTGAENVWAVTNGEGRAAPALYRASFEADGSGRGVGPFARRAHARSPEAAANLLLRYAGGLELTGVPKAEALTRSCELAAGCMLYGFPEDAEWARDGGVVAFAKELRLWDYGKPEAEQRKRRAERAGKRSAALQPLVDKGATLLPAQKRWLTGEQRRQLQANAAKRSGSGSRSGSSSSSSTARSYSAPSQSRGRSR